MIRTIGHNDVVDVILLMKKSLESISAHKCMADYDRDEATWIQFLINAIKEQAAGNPNFLVIGDFELDYKKSNLKGFLLAASFKTHYNERTIMDVKDCIIDPDIKPTYTVVRLFNDMIEHVKKHGGTRWRADSIRDETQNKNYNKLLSLKYNADINYSAHGKIGED
jgi:hypothetical protein